LSLEKIDLLNAYEKKSTNLSIEFIDNNDINEYYTEYRDIEKFVKKMNHSELEYTFSRLKDFTNILLSTVEDFESVFNREFSKDYWEEIAILLNRVYEFDESREKSVDNIYEFIKNVRDGKIINPLKEKVCKIVSKIKKNNSVILVDYNTKQVFDTDDLKEVEIISPNIYLKSENIYNYTIFLGSPRKFDDYNTVFLSENVLYIVYSFFKGEFKKEYLDFNGKKGINTIYKNVIFDTPENKVGAYKQESNDPLKRKFENIENVIAKNNSIEESTKARIIYLGGKKYISYPLGSKVNTIDVNPNMDIELKLEKMSVRQLRPGNWLLNTLFVEDEFYKQKSRSEFGVEKYNKALDLIEEYKELLRHEKDKSGGYSFLKKDLKKYGIEVNSLSVLRSWIEMITIKPGALDKILEYLGYEEEKIKEVIVAGENINKAHQFVGRMMNNNLIDELSKIQLEDVEGSLNEKHYFEFEIDDIGRFIITEVNYIFEEEILIKNKDLYKIKDID